MVKKRSKPLINVKKGGSNFTMKDCEFQMGESDRPVLDTQAENTKIEGTKVDATTAAKPNQWDTLIWKVLAPIAVTVVGGVLLYLLLGA